MSNRLHVVNPETCRGDGICVDICPEDVLTIVDDRATTIEERVKACIKCGQCVAVCPTDSLRMPDLPEKDFKELAKLPFGYDEFLDLLKLRRSVRVFKDKPVERELTDKILKAAATAPMGFPPHSTEVLVIESQAERTFLLKQLVRDYESTIKAFSSPVGRLMVRLAAGSENYHALKDYIVQIARHANDIYHSNGADGYMRGAPVLMLFHANRRAMSYEENAHIVCSYAMLTAVSLGLGTTIVGLIPPVVDRSKVLRKRYGIPKENKVITSLILGHPKYRYKKSIRRDLAGVRTL